MDKILPFLLRAMQDYLEKKLFKDKYRNWDERNFRKLIIIKLGVGWPMSTFGNYSSISSRGSLSYCPKIS
jgi:hypothetical protein